MLCTNAQKSVPSIKRNIFLLIASSCIKSDGPQYNIFDPTYFQMIISSKPDGFSQQSAYQNNTYVRDNNFISIVKI